MTERTPLLIDFEELLNMPSYQLHHFRFAVRLPITEVDPCGNGQTELSRHDFGIILSQHTASDQLFHDPCEVMQHIRIILPGLQLCQLRVLELLHYQHLSCLADMGIMENVADLPQNHPDS